MNLQDFINRHFFKNKAIELLTFIEENGLTSALDLSIELIHTDPLPALGTISEKVYQILKKPLVNRRDKTDYKRCEELLKEFSVRMMLEYYRRSNYTSLEFLSVLKESLKRAAPKVGVNPDTIDKDMEWEKVSFQLKSIKDETTKNLKLEIEPPMIRLQWNEEADFSLLKRFLVNEFRLFSFEKDVDNLFHNNVKRVICDDNQITFLTYLFRALCPRSKDDDILNGRLVSTIPNQKLWEALSQRLIKADGNKWTPKTLRNYHSNFSQNPNNEDLRKDVQEVVNRLKRSM